MSIDIQNVLTWAKDNQLMLGLLASAMVGTMPDTLPTLKNLPQWLWSWFHEASKTFLNYKRGIQEPAKEPPKQDPPKVTPPQQLNG